MGHIVQLFVKSSIVCGKLPRNYFTGIKVRGFLYKLLKEVDEDLAEKLHQAKKIAPISVTPLLGEKSPS